MTTAHAADRTRSNAGPARSGPPLLHLRGTSYGLVIHGLRMAAEGPHDAGYVTDEVLPVDGGPSM